MLRAARYEIGSPSSTMVLPCRSCQRLYFPRQRAKGPIRAPSARSPNFSRAAISRVKPWWPATTGTSSSSLPPPPPRSSASCSSPCPCPRVAASPSTSHTRFQGCGVAPGIHQRIQRRALRAGAGEQHRLSRGHRRNHRRSLHRCRRSNHSFPSFPTAASSTAACPGRGPAPGLRISDRERGGAHHRRKSRWGVGHHRGCPHRVTPHRDRPSMGNGWRLGHRNRCLDRPIDRSPTPGAGNRRRREAG